LKRIDPHCERAGKELKDAFGGNLCNAFDHEPGGSIRLLYNDGWFIQIFLIIGLAVFGIKLLHRRRFSFKRKEEEDLWIANR
jgi:hypothetical protein